MTRQLIKVVAPHMKLYRDDRTGIAWVENGTAGVSHSAHPNIGKTGSVRGMKDRGYWDANDRTVVVGDFIYNTSQFVASDQYDRIAAQHCECGGVHSSGD
jgi:hypothetical protein